METRRNFFLSGWFFWLTLYSIAMGLLEAAIVIYLRELYYPEGFSFPLHAVSPTVVFTELAREAATLIMLIAVGYFARKTFSGRFAGFIYAFAIWDIFYYVFLYVALGWPQSLMTWDVLFLLPSMWTGPVIAPVITSLSMIILASFIWRAEQRNGCSLIVRREWLLLITGSLVLIYGFMAEFLNFLLDTFSFGDLLSGLFTRDVLRLSLEFVPQHFPWGWFIAGQGIIFTGIGLYGWRTVLTKMKRGLL